jgi:hypothetical protein
MYYIAQLSNLFCYIPYLILQYINAVNPRYNRLVVVVASVIADIRYNRLKGYSRKYPIGHIANTRNKHRNNMIT